MHRSYAAPQGESAESAESWDATSGGDGNRPRTGWVIISGVVSIVAGALLAAGPYLPFGRQGDGTTEIDFVQWPTPLLLVVLAGLVTAAGLGSVLFARHAFGTALVGVAIAPAAAVAASQAPRVVHAVLSSTDRAGLRIGGWMVTAGTGVALVAALLAFLVMAARARGRSGSVAPFLGAVGAAGLLQWWLVAPTSHSGEPGTRYLVVDAGGSVWPGVVELCALALIVAAVAVAAGRCGAAAIGTAFGAALSVGLELAGRFVTTRAALQRDFGAELRGVSVVLTGATAAVLLVLTFALLVATSRQAAEATEPAGWPADQTAGGGAQAGWDQPNPEDPWPSSTETGTGTGVWDRPDSTSGGRSWSSESSSTSWPSQ